jgi:hypothetical protein
MTPTGDGSFAAAAGALGRREPTNSGKVDWNNRSALAAG